MFYLHDWAKENAERTDTVIRKSGENWAMHTNYATKKKLQNVKKVLGIWSFLLIFENIKNSYHSILVTFRYYLPSYDLMLFFVA